MTEVRLPTAGCHTCHLLPGLPESVLSLLSKVMGSAGLRCQGSSSELISVPLVAAALLGTDEPAGLR